MPRHQSQGKGWFQYGPREGFPPGTRYWEIDGQQQGDRTDPGVGLKKALPFIGGGLLLLLLLRKRK
jgi:hypothetical protein